MKAILLAAQIFFCATLAWACFCRLVRTDGETIREIRLAMWFEFFAAGMVMGAPFLPLLVPELNGHGHFRWQPYKTPTSIWILLLISATLVQLSTARFWRYGCPSDFQTRGFQ